MFSLADYNYTLPRELIAQEAIHPHHDARMMVVDRESGEIRAETTFCNIDEHLGDDRVIFFNDSRVVRSRVAMRDVSYAKSDGTTAILADGEIFYLSTQSDDIFEALVRPGNRFKIGTIFTIGEYRIEVIAMTESGRLLRILDFQSWILDFLSTHGALPLPPYIEYSEEKESDYQTSFARTDGSVAAPTASLHFTSELMDKIENQKEYLTLHVGLGTFKGIQTPDIRDYDIHREKIEIGLDIFEKVANIKTRKKKIVAVGTTACRTLESLPYLWMSLDQDMQNMIDANTRKYWDDLTEKVEKQDWIHDLNIHLENKILNFSTSIYITPGYIFHVIDDLVTNFHLGESSLLVLVSAFIGYDATMRLYEHAIEHRYRFYSFGDGMYIRGK
jgi:S-adenosylmethionine:tRNA ribosyltransferase-isomerase